MQCSAAGAGHDARRINSGAARPHACVAFDRFDRPGPIDGLIQSVSLASEHLAAITNVLLPLQQRAICAWLCCLSLRRRRWALGWLGSTTSQARAWTQPVALARVVTHFKLDRPRPPSNHHPTPPPLQSRTSHSKQAASKSDERRTSDGRAADDDHGAEGSNQGTLRARGRKAFIHASTGKDWKRSGALSAPAAAGGIWPHLRDGSMTDPMAA